MLPWQFYVLCGVEGHMEQPPTHSNLDKASLL